MHDVLVFCCVCGAGHRPGSPAVLFRSADHRWWCADEFACFLRARLAEQAAQDAARHAAEVAAMYRALDRVWASLEAGGWKLMRNTQTTTIEVWREDRDRIKALAAQLTADGPGRFDQKDAIRWLLDQREALAAR